MVNLCLGDGCTNLTGEEIFCAGCDRAFARDTVEVTGVTSSGATFTYGSVQMSVFLAMVDPFQWATDGFQTTQHVGFVVTTGSQFE